VVVSLEGSATGCRRSSANLHFASAAVNCTELFEQEWADLKRLFIFEVSKIIEFYIDGFYCTGINFFPILIFNLSWDCKHPRIW
jgi:hypothetical protein